MLGRGSIWKNVVLITLSLGPFSASPLLAASHDCAVLNVPGVPSGINNAGVIVGSGNGHGFIRDAAGHVTTIDYPGTTSATQLFAVNNNGVITGQWGGNHGMPGTFGFFTVDLAGNFKPISLPPPYDSGYLLSIYGINDRGEILFFAYSNSDASYLILKPDGTVTVIHAAALSGPGSLNNSDQFLASDASGSRLVNPDGTTVLIKWNHPKSFWPAIAFGLNNLGDVVGSVSTYVKAQQPPWSAFVRSASGNFSALDCAGLADITPSAINDGGVVVGNSSGGPFVATPVPGTPVFQDSTQNLVVPTMLGNSQTSSAPPQGAPASFTVSNSGNARLDLGGPKLVGQIPPFGPPFFAVSACANQGTPVTSLNPGESCVVTVTAVPPSGFQGTLHDTIYFEDSSAGSPHTIPVSATVVQSASPLCQEYTVSAASPRQAGFSMQDTTSGLASITVLNSTNATLNIPAFTPGTKDVVPVSATSVDATQPSQVDFQITTQAGVSAACGSSFGVSQWTGFGGMLPGKIAVAGNSNGQLQAFVRGFNNELWTIAQTAPSGGWGSWVSLGWVLGSNPAVGVNQDGRLQVFVLGNDSALWTIAQTAPGGGWSAWQSLAGTLISDPAVATDGNGDLEVVSVGPDLALWLISQTAPGGSWSAWNPLGGGIQNNPALLANQDGRLQTFVIGFDNAVWTNAQTSPGGSWSGWMSLGGSFGGDPVAAANNDGRLQVFAMGTDNALWTAAQTTLGGALAGFSPLGGIISSSPAVAINGDGRLEAFARGLNNDKLWHLSQTTPGGSWSAWATLDGIVQPPVSAAQNQDGRLTALVKGGDGALWIIEQSAPGLWN